MPARSRVLALWPGAALAASAAEPRLPDLPNDVAPPGDTADILRFRCECRRSTGADGVLADQRVSEEFLIQRPSGRAHVARGPEVNEVDTLYADRSLIFTDGAGSGAPRITTITIRGDTVSSWHEIVPGADGGGRLVPTRHYGSCTTPWSPP